MLKTLPELYPLTPPSDEVDGERPKYVGFMTEFHRKVSSGNSDELREYIVDNVTGPEDFFQDYNGMTILHHACSFPHKRKATEMLKCILESYHLKSDENQQCQLLNAQTNHPNWAGQTALHIAAQKYNREAVIILMNAGADLNIRCAKGIEPITLIYQNVPRAVLAMFDDGMKLHGEDVDPGDEDLQVSVRFAVIVGTPGPNDDKSLLPNETSLITTVIKECPRQASEVLLHPLVRLFLHYKWNNTNIKYMIWLSMICHIIWSLACTTYFVNFYWHNCPYTRNSTVVSCNYQSPTTSVLAVTVFIMCLVAIAKEIYEIASILNFRYYIEQKENICQWLLSAFVLTLTTKTICFWDVTPDGIARIQAWEYPLAAGAAFLAFALILVQLGKYPKIGIYMEILELVSQKSLYFLFVYGCLLIAFWASFVILLPERPEFGLPGFVKIVTIMTGESNYDDLFFGDTSDVTVQFALWTQVLFLAATLILTIVLQNLLIGVLVSDIQALKEKGQLSSIKTQLREINLMETFLLSSFSQNRIFKRRWLQSLLVTNREPTPTNDKIRKILSVVDSPDTSDSFHIIGMHDDNIPAQLRDDIRVFFEKQSENQEVVPESQKK